MSVFTLAAMLRRCRPLDDSARPQSPMLTRLRVVTVNPESCVVDAGCSTDCPGQRPTSAQRRPCAAVGGLLARILGRRGPSGRPGAQRRRPQPLSSGMAGAGCGGGSVSGSHAVPRRRSSVQPAAARTPEPTMTCMCCEPAPRHSAGPSSLRRVSLCIRAAPAMAAHPISEAAARGAAVWPDAPQMAGTDDAGSTFAFRVDDDGREPEQQPPRACVLGLLRCC
jgi:hypothetical protein